MCVRSRLVRVRRIPRVACADARENRVIRRIDVAIGAGRAVMRNLEVTMVENRAEPGRGDIGRMAGNARCRVICRHVIRHCAPIRLRIREVRLMAAIAVRGGIAGRVVSSDVAVCAGIHHGTNRTGHRRARRNHVRALQGEARGAVVKLSIRPENCVVAGGAQGGGEACRNVVGNISAKSRSAVPRSQVTAIAIGVGRSQVVVVVDVAVRAGVHLTRGSQLVRTGERESRRGVIERRREEADCVVAGRAVRRRKGSASRGVIRIRRSLPPTAIELR